MMHRLFNWHSAIISHDWQFLFDGDQRATIFANVLVKGGGRSAIRAYKSSKCKYYFNTSWPTFLVLIRAISKIREDELSRKWPKFPEMEQQQYKNGHKMHVSNSQSDKNCSILNCQSEDYIFDLGFCLSAYFYTTSSHYTWTISTSTKLNTYWRRYWSWTELTKQNACQ